MNSKNNERVFAYTFGDIYKLYIEKVEKKGRTVEELDQVLTWLTGYDKDKLQTQIDKKSDLRTFFEEAPTMNPNRTQIKGVICGVRVEDIEDPLMQNIRYMDKLVDEIAKGKAIEKIMR